MKFKILLFIIALICVLLFGCSDNNADKTVNKPIEYVSISQEEAKKLIDNDSDKVILDVRTQEEFDEKHILNAVLIPDYEIGEKAESILTDKNQLILVYCRSGRRSKNASAVLAEMGYTNVKEFGGIIDWQYETE